MKHSFIVFVISLVCLVECVSARDWIALFGSRDCDECAKIKALWNEAYTDLADPALIYLCVDDAENYEFLKIVESEMKIKRPSMAFPIMLIGDTMIAGYDGLLELGTEGMNELLGRVPDDAPVLAPICDAAEETEEPVTEIHARDFADSLPEDMRNRILGSVAVGEEGGLVFKVDAPQLLYIFQTGCQKCSRQLKELKMMAARVPGLRVSCYNIAEADGQAMMQRVKANLQPAEDAGKEIIPPLLAWDDGYIADRLATTEELLEVLQKQEKDVHFWNEPISETERSTTRAMLEKVVNGATVGVIALAGLLDGINPCAFATSIFLIGYLLYLKRRPRQIILVGASFCLGVFITYLLFGIGLSFLINYLNRYVWIKMAIYGIFALVALVLAIMNIHDAWIFKRTQKASQMNLGLSGETHHKMHEKIRRLVNVGAWIMIPAAIALGVVISAMELACTGQIYLPTLAAINSTGMTWRAFYLLMLYNVAFILPLVAVTGLAAGGCGAKRLADWARNNVFSTKVIMGVLFGAIACLMLWFTLAAAPKDLPDTAQNCLAEETEAAAPELP